MQRNGCAANGTGQPACASCKHQRKRCDENCVLSPYFPADRAADFRAVQKVFGVSNVSKMLQAVVEEHRKRLAESLVWEATCRQRDPVLGAYGEFQRVQKELRYYQGMAAATRLKPPPQCHQPYKPALPGMALVEWRYSNNNNNNNHSNSKDSNGIITSNGAGNNTNGTNFSGGGINAAAASVPNYAHDSSGSVIDPSPYGSTSVLTNGQSPEIMNHQKREAAPVNAVPRQPQQQNNGFNHQQPYYSLSANH